jgi:hypothetical protein
MCIKSHVVEAERELTFSVIKLDQIGKHLREYKHWLKGMSDIPVTADKCLANIDSLRQEIVSEYRRLDTLLREPSNGIDDNSLSPRARKKQSPIRKNNKRKN